MSDLEGELQDKLTEQTAYIRKLMKAFNKEFPIGAKFVVRTRDSMHQELYTCSCALMKSGRYAIVFVIKSTDNQEENFCISVHELMMSLIDREEPV